MPRRLKRNELEQLHLEPGEAVLVEVDRNLTLLWIALAIVGMGLVTYGVSDPVYGWGVFFLGFVAVTFVGGAATSIRVFVTNRRVVRIGALGKRSIAMPGPRVAWTRDAFGERLRVESDADRLVVRNVRNADAVRSALAARAS